MVGTCPPICPAWLRGCGLNGAGDRDRGDLLRRLTTSDASVSLLIGEEIISGLRKSYNAVKEGQSLLILNSSDYLEIAINCGNAAKSFGARLYDSVTISLI